MNKQSYERLAEYSAVGFPTVKRKVNSFTYLFIVYKDIRTQPSPSALLRCNIQKQILYRLILDSEALRHILHCHLEFSVPSAKPLLKQCCLLRIRLFNADRMKQLFIVFEHRNIPPFGGYCFLF